MDQYKRAYDTLCNLTLCGTCTSGDHKQCDRYNVKVKALESLQKQIPRKPLRTETIYVPQLQVDVLYGVCPSCGYAVCNTAKYCVNCGQAIDWESKTAD